MSDLFAWFQNYLSLSKIAAVTVPGMIVAFALILVLGPIPCVDTSKSCPFCSPTLKPPSPPAETSGLMSLSPKTLTFVAGGKEPRELKLTSPRNVDLSTMAVSLSGHDKDLFTFKTNCKDPKVLGPGKDCTVDVTFEEPFFSLGWFRPRSIPIFLASLSVQANDPLSGDRAEATALLVWGSNPSSVRNLSAANSQKTKSARTTVVTSSGPWLKAGTDATAASDQETTPSSPSSSNNVAPPSRESLLGQFENLLPRQFKPLEPLPLLHNLNESCRNMPLYILPNSRPPAEKSDSKTNDGSKSKAGAPQYTEETTRSVEEILSTADSCYGNLARYDEELQKESAKQQVVSSQDTTDLGTLSSNLVTAQNSGDRLVEHDLIQKINLKKKEIQDAQEYSKTLTQADSYVATLSSQVASIRNLALSQANSAPPAPSSTPSAAMDVFRTIEQNLIKFLLFSLILGQILDPIQRGLVSFFGPRRNILEVFNDVYGQKGDGEFRYGDRRIPPWTLPEDFQAKFSPPETPKEADKITKQADDEGLRFGPADFAFLRNRNIYDQNYAIGAGYISQSEFNGIFNEYYTQSQITSGMILPLIILPVCIGIRIICCATLVPTGGSGWLLAVPICGAMYIGVLLGLGLTFLVTSLGSRAYGRILHALVQSLFSKSRKMTMRLMIIVAMLIVLFFFFLLTMYANANVLDWDVLPIVGLPCVFLCPLWVSGLDRLHKYYSELQARIGGNILRLQQSTQQKMIDQINQSESLVPLQQNLKQAADSNKELADFLNKYIEEKKQSKGSDSTPEGDVF